MISEKDALLQQITSTIKNKWSKECKDILDNLFIIPCIDTNESQGKEGNNFQNNTVSISRIKERLEALEEVSDNIYYSLCYLVENLPELISKTILSDPDNFRNLNLYKNTSGIVTHEGKQADLQATIPHPTRRENDILELLEKGYCAKEIALRLFISETTVITHKKNLKKKFNVKNTVELISIIKNRK